MGVKTLLNGSGFDIWSQEYDNDVKRGSKGYPFEGYYDVLNCMYELVPKRHPCSVLDIGIGTGMLSRQLYQDGAAITGIDFSEGMLHLAQAKLPNARLLQWDLNGGIPPQLAGETFDCILSSYVFHHFVDRLKVELIGQLKQPLRNGGRLIIGDVAFASENDRNNCRLASGDGWDQDEIYLVMDSFQRLLAQSGLQYGYSQISPCAGVFVIEK